MTLLWHPAAVKELRKLPREIQIRIVPAVEGFYETGRGNIRHVHGKLWALASGFYRIYYWREREDFGIVGVDHRKHAYIPERVEALEKRLGDSR